MCLGVTQPLRAPCGYLLRLLERLREKIVELAPPLFVNREGTAAEVPIQPCIEGARADCFC
jgi:hypothetical protein